MARPETFQEFALPDGLLRKYNYIFAMLDAMKKIKEKYLLAGIGIAIGVICAVVARLFFEQEESLASISFFFFVPAIIGVIPLMFINKERLRTYKAFIFIPWLTLGCFFTTLYFCGVEDFLCILILAAPFFILGTIGALLYVLYLINKGKGKHKLYSILIIPFLISPIEQVVDSPCDIYAVPSEILISAQPSEIWDNIIEVKTIHSSEYDRGIFNMMGIPRPISAQVNSKKVGGQRIGNFENGLRFIENIVLYHENEKVAFDITVDNSSVGDEVFEQHVLKGNYFKFVDACYELRETESGSTILYLTTRYQLKSKINFYGKFWADIMLRDFQDRLLDVIKNRCEIKNS